MAAFLEISAFSNSNSDSECLSSLNLCFSPLPPTIKVTTMSKLYGCSFFLYYRNPGNISTGISRTNVRGN